MIITAGILFYLLDRYGDMQHICHGSDRMELKRTEHFRNQGQTEKGVLYVYADKEGVLLFCSEKKLKPANILIKAFKDSGESFSSLWIPYGNLDEEPQSRAYLADEVNEYISQIWNHFTQLQNEILEAILNQESVEAIMEKVRVLLREPFSIVDRDMLLLYQHPDVPRIMAERLGPSYENELQDELLITKEFHDVARKTEPFYYFMESPQLNNYCVNIIVDGYYYARLVLPLPEGQPALSSGAEQLAEYLARVLVKMIRSGSLQVQRSQDDLMHRLCYELAGDISPEPSDIAHAVTSYHWELSDTYQVFCLEPYKAAGWETQIENTIPVMIRKLEQTWPQSCAAETGKRILWILNLSHSDQTGAEKDLSRELPLLLRDNVFRAGASSSFSDAGLFSSALAEAEAALEIGSRKDPSHWYYRFDKYRLVYMFEAISGRGIDTRLLVHPAIPVLLEHDKVHESQLSDTLKMLLEKRGNVTQAAEALFIHRTTLFRRMNQIKELTGLDLDDSDEMLSLQLSYRLLESKL